MTTEKIRVSASSVISSAPDTSATPRRWAGKGDRSSVKARECTMAARKVNYSTVPATAAEKTETGWLVLLCVASWAIPGAGHLWLGRRAKGLVFLVALPLMFAVGLALHGRIFPFDASEPLVALAAFADLGAGFPYFVAAALGFGRGEVTMVTYEYGNAFLIVAGLLNLLVVIDAWDVALGRK